MTSDVDGYINKQKSPQKEICKKLRQIILKTYPTIKEEMKLGVPYYEDKIYIVALKNHVNFGFSIKDFTKDEIKKFKGSGKTTKVIEIYSLKDINEKDILNILKKLLKPYEA